MSDQQPADATPDSTAGREAARAPAALADFAPGQKAAPPAQLVRSPLSDGEWHRMHPLTPLLQGGFVLIVVIGLIVANMRDRIAAIFMPIFAPDLAEDFDRWESGNGDPIDWIVANDLYLLAAGVVLLVLVVVTVLFYLSWRFHAFRITGDDVEVKSGIVFRTQRRAPLDRVQGVNLTRPMIARLLGMGKLAVVGAGVDSNVKLEYLGTANAEAIRADILRLASGRRLAEAEAREGGSGEGPRTGEGADEHGSSRLSNAAATVSQGITGIFEGAEPDAGEPESVVRIPVIRLIMAQVLSGSTIWFLAIVAAIIVGAVIGTPWILFAALPAAIGFGTYTVRSLVRSLRYSIAPTSDGVRVSFGLLTTVTEIIPPGRIHSIEVTQSILWRPAKWWIVRINRLSGRSSSDTTVDQFTTLLPVGTIDDVARVLRLALPGISDEDVRTVLDEGALGGPGDSFVNTPKRAWIVRPMSWRRNGYRLLDHALLLRRGLLLRKVAIVPLARMQSIGMTQGPFARALGVANMRPHVVTGPVYSYLAGVDRDRAIALFEDTARLAVAASHADRTHRWAAPEDRAAEAAGAQVGAETDGQGGPARSATLEAGSDAGFEGARAAAQHPAATSGLRSDARRERLRASEELSFRGGDPSEVERDGSIREGEGEGEGIREGDRDRGTDETERDSDSSDDRGARDA